MIFAWFCHDESCLIKMLNHHEFDYDHPDENHDNFDDYHDDEEEGIIFTFGHWLFCDHDDFYHDDHDNDQEKMIFTFGHWLSKLPAVAPAAFQESGTLTNISKFLNISLSLFREPGQILDI